MVVMGLDFGEKRIGVAVSDREGIIATGLDTIERDEQGSEFDEIERIVREREVERIVVGIPYRMDGAEGPEVHRARGFLKTIRRRLPDVETDTMDERLSSAQAHQTLSQAGVTNRVRRGSVDRMSAQIILTRYLGKMSQSSD